MFVAYHQNLCIPNTEWFRLNG